MNENLKAIEDLLSFCFKIDTYQRGYRWDTAQVYSLLNDINEFSPEFQSFYCLQPLVVKKIDDNTFELVDGQQRATTIFLILTYYNYKTYHLIYTTRGTEESGLNSFFEMLIALETPQDLISSNSDDFSDFDRKVSSYWKEKITKENPNINTVDNFYFYRTYSVIKSWFSQLDDITKEQFKYKLLTQTKVIWYIENEDSTEQNIINKFIDFNQGKIELEQAELIKALFVLDLKKISNTEQRQYEENQFADEWNQIEQQMSEEKFWQFISNSKYNSNIANKINLLFQLYNGFAKKTEDHFYNYRKFEKAFKNTDENKKPSWQRITGLYNGLEEWFFDRTSYHLVGAVIHLTNNNILNILETAKIAENKIHFCNLLRDKIKSCFKDDNIWKKSYDPELIKYGDGGVFNLLLLYNIALTEIEEVDTFFPFNRFYKTTDWNIEHILAKNADSLDTFDEFQNFHSDMFDLINKLDDEISKDNKSLILNLCKELNEFIKNKQKSFCKGKIGEINVKLSEFLSINDFNNLCLLDQSTNVKVGKKPFRRKRDIILNLNTEIQLKPNTYIPIGTQYVFSKKSTPSTFTYFQIDYWSQKDKEFYLKKVESIIYQFLDTK